MIAVEPVVVVLMLDGIDGGCCVVPRLLVAVFQERFEVRYGVSPERVRKDAARLHPWHVRRIAEGVLCQRHDLRVITSEPNVPEQDRVPPCCVPDAGIGRDEAGEQCFQPVFLETAGSAVPRSV